MSLDGSGEQGSLQVFFRDGAAAGTCLEAMTSYFQIQLTAPVSGSRSGLTPSQLTGTFLGMDLEEARLGFPVSSILELTFGD